MTTAPAPTCPPADWKVVGLLAIARYLVGQISEGLLSKKLGLDRLETRACVQAFLDTAIANAPVPIERINTLEQRYSTLSAQLAARDGENHTLRNDLQAALLKINELETQKGTPPMA